MHAQYSPLLIGAYMVLSAPLFISVSLSSSCNLACSHCAVDARKSQKKAMQTRYTNKILNYCIKKKVPVLEITGGEPLLFLPQVLKIGKVAKKHGILWGITTNGTLLTGKTIDKLQQAGVYAIKVSLEGTKECNDLVRGQGSFDKTVDAIKKCLAKKLPFAILTSLSKKNVNKMSEYIDFLDGLGVKLVIFFPMLPLGRAKSLKKQLLKKNDLKKFLDLIKSKKTKQLTINMEMPELMTNKGDQVFAKGCPVGYSFHICYNGDVWPCPIFPLALGNIKEKPIEKIWENTFFNKIKNPENLKGTCRSCKQKQSCNGGCRAMSFLAKGSYFEQDPYCKSFKVQKNV